MNKYMLSSDFKACLLKTIRDMQALVRPQDQSNQSRRNLGAAASGTGTS